MDRRANTTLVTVSEIRSHVHKIEGAVEEDCEKMPESDYLSWTFPEDIVELHAPEDDVIFHDESDNETTMSRGQQQENSTTDSTSQKGHGNIPHGLSPPGQYVPAGAEGDDAISSSSSYGEEETVEEGLASYFSNPSYRAANPELLDPVNLEEDWGDASPTPLPPQSPHKIPQQPPRSEKRQRYLQRKREEETE